MSGFAGKDPNGTWSLYVVDDQNGDAGAIHGGWSLSIASTSPPASPPPPPPPPPPVPPVITSSTHHTQRVLKTRGVVLDFSTSQGGSLVATGSVNVPNGAKTYRFRTVRRNVAAGAVRVKLKLPSAALHQIGRALASHRRLTAKVTLALTAASGEKSVKRLPIRLR
jgi:hypothetical protein